MSRLAHHIFTMACNNAWANHRLLGAVGQLSQADFEAPRVGFFPSLRDTLNHLVTVDWLYVDALERALTHQPPHPEPGRFFTPEVPFATCAALRDAQHAVDQRLIALTRRLAVSPSAAVPSLEEAQLDTPVGIRRTRGLVFETASRILAHLFQHQLHHRGQAHAMLAGTAVAPPQLDEFFCADEAHLRADELAELGLSEAAIWSPAATPRHARSGSPYEARYGFSRAVRVGKTIHVAGTAPIWPDGSCDPSPAAQTRRAFEIALGALAELGGRVEDVVRTRMYITDAADADTIGEVHGAIFSRVNPAATMVVVAALLDPRWRIEVEVEAAVG